MSFYSEGYRLVGNLHWPPGFNRDKAPGVVLCHGLASNKDSQKWLAFAARLEEAGFAALRFNFRGCGGGDERSEGDFSATTLTGRVKDFRAALDFLATTGKVDMGRLGAVGSSFGGCVIIAAGDPRPQAYVALATPYRLSGPVAGDDMPGTDSPRMARIRQDLYDDFRRYDLGASINRLNRPCLIIHGDRDDIPVNDARRLYESARPPRRLEVIAGGSHRFTDSGHLNLVVGLGVDWLKQYLK